jgi:hypothetical protein
MRVLLVIPPMVDLNAPYPSTAYLAGYLAQKPYDVRQWDASLDVFLRIHSAAGLRRLRASLATGPRRHDAMDDPAVRWFVADADRHEMVVERVIRFLQGRDPTLAHRIVGGLLPRGPSAGILAEADLSAAFGALGLADRAKYVATTYLANISRAIAAGVDANWRNANSYALASEQPLADRFDAYEAALDAPPTAIVDTMLEALDDTLAASTPDVVGLTVPFYGNLLGALHFAKRIKERLRHTSVIVGGGLINTSLRSMTDARLFKHVDFVTVDDGERPLECILESLAGRRSADDLLRTFVCRDGEVRMISASGECDVSHRDAPAPTYAGLPLGNYVSMLKLPNPVQRLWSDGRWNKLTIAHGCYWGKCTFCDVMLDYVGRYEPAPADTIVDRMLRLIAETGETGFHFVDEAAPPAALRSLSRRLLERAVVTSWWTNIRFEKTFNADLVQLMARAGCIGVTGGLEVASDRLLKLINKGVTVRQVANVTHAFAEAGIGVHAYLMYGFPSQTEQELIDSLEIVRQLFENRCVHSAFWHDFFATAHSPIAARPDLFGVRLREPIAPQPLPLRRHTAAFSLTLPGGRHRIAGEPSVAPRTRDDVFLQYGVPIDDAAGHNLQRFSRGLRVALYHYMHRLKLDRPVHEWFDWPVPESSLSRTLVADYLAAGPEIDADADVASVAAAGAAIA